MKKLVVYLCCVVLTLCCGQVEASRLTNNDTQPMSVIYLTELAKLKHQAEKGDKDAQFKLANIYFNPPPKIRVKQNYHRAMDWYLKAASSKHADAMYNIGFMYYKGYGVEVDDVQAISWFKLAERNGSKLAKRTLTKLAEYIDSFDDEEITQAISSIESDLRISSKTK